MCDHMVAPTYVPIVLSLGRSDHRSSVKSTLLSAELRGSQEARALLQRENEALLAAQAALHTQCRQCSQAAAAGERRTQGDVLALLLRLQEGHCAQLLQANQQLHTELKELRASTARLHSRNVTISKFNTMVRNIPIIAIITVFLQLYWDNW